MENMKHVIVVGLLALGLSSGTELGVAQTDAGYFASDNVEHVAHIPLNSDSAGARVVGSFLYLTTSRDLKIYDVSDPEVPRLAGELLLPQMPYFVEEDVDTNGKILLIDGPNGPLSRLYVIDVEDKSDPAIIGELRGEGTDQHTFTCVLDCKWVYGSRGAVIDLRDPTRPRYAGDWRTGTPLSDRSAHDVTEVAPGRILTSSEPMMLLDARKDPRRPRVIALGERAEETDVPGYFWHVHGTAWPRGGRDSLILTSGESLGPRCEDSGAAFITWEARGWRRTRTFRIIDEYRVANGSYTDGNAPINHLCSHWFDPHPRFRDGGLVAMGWYDHGVRFLDVSRRGRIDEVGYFVRSGSAMSAAYWVTDEVVYALDYHYGLDILRFSDNPSPAHTSDRREAPGDATS